MDHAPHLQAVHAVLLGLHLEGGGDVLDGGQGWVPLLGLQPVGWERNSTAGESRGQNILPSSSSALIYLFEPYLCAPRGWIASPPTTPLTLTRPLCRDLGYHFARPSLFTK